MLSPEEVQQILRQTGAMLSGHFLLSSGLHSPLYIQCALVFQHPGHAGRLGAAMAHLFHQVAVDVVVSPAVGGIVVGQEVARALGVRAIFGERESGRMRLRRGFHVGEGERVLVVDDVMTRGGSVGELLRAIEPEGVEVVGIAVVVDRSGEEIHWPVPHRSLLKIQATNYPAEDCPLCREKIPLVKPGSRERPDR